MFRRFAHQAAILMGKPGAFLCAVLVVVAWAASGRYFQFSDTWQLVINTGTTVVTFLMVFLIQSTQNRDSLATQLKLDELIRANRHARNKLIDLEELSDEELESLHREFNQLKAETERRIGEIEKAKRG